PLHLRPGAREWYGRWLVRERPDLVPRYRELYARGAYLSRDYQREITARVRAAARRYGLDGGAPADHRNLSAADRSGRARPDPDRRPSGSRPGAPAGPPRPAGPRGPCARLTAARANAPRRRATAGSLAARGADYDIPVRPERLRPRAGASPRGTRPGTSARTWSAGDRIRRGAAPRPGPTAADRLQRPGDPVGHLSFPLPAAVHRAGTPRVAADPPVRRAGRLPGHGRTGDRLPGHRPGPARLLQGGRRHRHRVGHGARVHIV